MTKSNFKDEERIALHNICTLAASMRDCGNCQFKIGLLYDAFLQVKQLDQPVNLDFQRAQFVQRIQNINLNLITA